MMVLKNLGQEIYNQSNEIEKVIFGKIDNKKDKINKLFNSKDLKFFNANPLLDPFEVRKNQIVIAPLIQFQTIRLEQGQ